MLNEAKAGKSHDCLDLRCSPLAGTSFFQSNIVSYCLKIIIILY